MDITSFWYVLYVKSRHENKVSSLLKEKGFDTYAPTVKTIKQWSDRKKTVYLPLFPSYVFVNFKNTKEFNYALSIPGACSYIRFGKEYAKVSNEEICKIKLLVDFQYFENIESTNLNFREGERCTIHQGPLEGLECDILKCDQKNKIIVRINSIHQNIIATLPKAFLHKNDMEFFV